MSALTKKEEQEKRALEAQIARLERLEAEKSAAEEKLQEMLQKKVQTYRDKIQRLRDLIASKERIIEKCNEDIANMLAQINDLEAVIVEILGDNPTFGDDE